MIDYLFFNVDTQNDFMRKDGALYIEGAEEIYRNLYQLTNFAKEKNIKVINTCDWHNKKCEEFSNNPDYITTFPPHCIKNTYGAEFLDLTEPEDPYIVEYDNFNLDIDKIDQKRNIIIRKNTFDVFSNYSTNDILKYLNPDTIIVYGVASDVCVDLVVRGLLDMDMSVCVVKDAIKELPGSKKPYVDWFFKGAILTQMKRVQKI